MQDSTLMCECECAGINFHKETSQAHLLSFGTKNTFLILLYK